MKRMITVGAVALALAGCQTGDEYQAGIDASLNARLEANNGKSMAEFMGRTGMLPLSTYDVSEGRVFVFRTDPVYMTLPATHVTPAITRSAQCQLLVRAVPVGSGQGADNWKIVGTERTGPCNNLPV